VTTELITIVEIDQPQCSLIYGSAPCTAALGTTGEHKCFNTWATCQDQDNYDATELTLRFFSEVENPPKNLQMLPLVRGVNSRPTELNIVGGDPGSSPLGKRARVTIRMGDMPYHDRLVDKYWRDRLSGAGQVSGIGYDPAERGTFWTKWLARNPNYATIPVRVRRGTIDQATGSLSNMQTEHYILDSIDGPGSRGEVTITAKDILALADNDRAVAPAPSPGRIQAEITAAANVPITATLLPAGVGDTDYSASGRLRIGREIFTFTRSSDTLTLTARAQNGTDATTHNADSTVQECYVVTNTRVDSVIEDLLTNYAGVDAAYINASDWGDEAGRWLSTYDLNAVVSEPTGVTQLIGEILQVCTCFVWWDAENQQIQFRAIRPQLTARNVDDTSHILADSFQQVTKADERITQLIIFYDQINPTERQNEGSNYARANVFFPPGTRAPNDTDERVRTIHTRWLTGANIGEVVSTGAKIMQRYYRAPVKTSFALDRSEDDIELADVVGVFHHSLTDAVGNAREFPAQIIGIERLEGGSRIQYTAIPYDFAGRFGYIVANGTLPYLFVSGDQRQLGVWFADETTNEMPNGDPAYVFA
jgi:hypothetical protein